MSAFSVFLLQGIEDLRLATKVSELGVLSKAEELGVFSKLEGAGAFSLAEKALPLIEKLKLLSIFEACLDIEAGFIFTFANTLLFTGPAIATLQITGFLPIPKGPGFVGELAFDAAVLAAGATFFGIAYLVSQLQLAADIDD